MVNLKVIRDANSTLVQSQPLVAVFFGGTSGIGHYTLRALARACATKKGKGFRAYVVGRKEKAAIEIIAECRGIYPQGEYQFVKADDLSLMHDVDRVCAEIISLENKQGQEPRIDYLMVSQGGPIFQPRKDTKEGIDVTMSLMYYSRMRTVLNFLPLLLKSSLPATIVSVYAAGMEGQLFPNDLSLRDLKHYTYSQARSHMVYMHTFFMETIAEQHPEKLRMMHIFPGLVLGPGFDVPEYSWWFRILWGKVFTPLFGWATIQPQDCGDRMLFLASSHYPSRSGDPAVSQGTKAAAEGTDGRIGSGAYALGYNCEKRINPAAYNKINRDELRTKVWGHTLEAFQVIQDGKVFTG